MDWRRILAVKVIILQNLEFSISKMLFSATAIVGAHSWKIYQSRPSLACETLYGYYFVILG